MANCSDNSWRDTESQVTQMLFEAADRVAQQSGVRMTRIRRHVYRLLLDTDEPLSAYDIADMLQGVACPKPPTAYRALDCLEQLGLIRKLRSISKYVALRSGPDDTPSAFLVCRKCGSTEQVQAADEREALCEIAGQAGFTNLDATIEILGHCRLHSD